MSRPDRYGRRFPSRRRRIRGRSVAEGSQDRSRVELEEQRARALIELERLQAVRQELDEARSRLDAIYRSIPIGYVTLDEKGVITDWNDSAARLLGVKSNSLLGAPFVHFVVSDDVPIILRHLRQCSRAPGGRVTAQLHFKQDQGPPLPVELVSRAFRHRERLLVQTALIDLTERKPRERDSAESGELADAMIQTIHEPLLVLDASLKIVRVNEAFADLFRVTPQAVRGGLIEATLNLWWTGNELRRNLERALWQGVPLKDLEFEVHPPNIGRRIFLFNARRLPPRSDALPLLLVALEDITARKEAE